MLLIHPDKTCTAVSIQAQQFARNEDGAFEIPPALAAEAQSLLKMAPDKRAPKADPRDAAKTDGDEFDKMNRFELFAFAKANGLTGFNNTSTADDMRSAFRARAAAPKGEA